MQVGVKHQAQSQNAASTGNRTAHGEAPAQAAAAQPAASQPAAAKQAGDHAQLPAGKPAMTSTEAVAKANATTEAVMAKFDKDQDGGLDMAEMDALVADAGGDAKVSMAADDTDQDGKLSENELVEGFAKSEKGPIEPTMIEKAKAALDTTHQALEGAKGLLDQAGKATEALLPGATDAVEGLKGAVEAVDGKVQEAQEMVDQAQPMAFTEQEKAQLEQASKTLEKLAGDDGVWDGQDVERNLEQMGKESKFSKVVPRKLLTRGQDKAGISKTPDASGRQVTAAGTQAGQAEITTSDLRDFTSAMDLIESKSTSKAGGSFPNGMPVKFLHDVASDRPPIIPAGVKVDLAAAR